MMMLKIGQNLQTNQMEKKKKKKAIELCECKHSLSYMKNILYVESWNKLTSFPYMYIYLIIGF